MVLYTVFFQRKSSADSLSKSLRKIPSPTPIPMRSVGFARFDDRISQGSSHACRQQTAVTDPASFHYVGLPPTG